MLSLKKIRRAVAVYPHRCFFVLLLMLTACRQGKWQNHLQHASSPYLKEHADNPVDWYEWGDEALDKAKKENKPLLISIGYASCHWCHVMAKESFMDTAVARVMNENFVCIKVDREERPDIDNIYMNALQLLTGNSGWPLNAFALPDGKPFYAGTYYEKKNWISLLQQVSKSYQTRYKLVETQAKALVNGIAVEDTALFTANMDYKKDNPPVGTAGLYKNIYLQADLLRGGFKGAPKFPAHALAEFMMQDYYITGNQQSLKLATTTLQKMALGGIYDHAGGGFARYATDSNWRVPHFEKMLYDNGLLVSAYAHAYQLTQDSFYKTIVSETLDFLEASLAAKGGGYYSSLNADTEAGEGAYYSWTEKDFLQAAGGDQQLAAYFNVTAKGNWEPGKNILYAEQTANAFAVSHKTDPSAFYAKLSAAKQRLFNERKKRVSPAVDTKIITAWNSIVVKAYADAYAATGTAAYLTKAMQCAKFLETKIIQADGSLVRNIQGGKTEGFLDDYAATVAAFIRLYEVSFDQHWLDLARQLTVYTLKNFYNPATGLFYYAKKQADLIVRRTDVTDNEMPSSNAVLAKSLYTLGIMYDDTVYTNNSIRMYQAMSQRISREPRYYLQWCSFGAYLSAAKFEVVIAGNEALRKNNELQRNYLPDCITMGSREDKDLLPLVAGKFKKEKTLIYVCTDKLCKRPEEETVKALQAIKAGKRH